MQTPSPSSRKRPPASFTLLIFLVAASACHSQPVKAADLLVETAAFQQCEAEAFISLIIARNGMHLKDTRSSLLAIKSNGDFQIKTINQLFDELDATGSKDHGGFAARKFYECAQRETLGVEKNHSGAAVCLARHDIVFYATADRNKGIAQADAVARIKNSLSRTSKAIYPEALVEQLVPMTYRVASFDDDYLLRQMVFETCLFPEDWKAWYEATQGGGK
jgi:hypothetical protein